MGEIKGILLVCILIFNGLKPTAQSTPFVEAGLIKSFLTISPSRMTGQDYLNIYLHGNLEYYLSDKFSLAGDSYVYMGKLSLSEEVFSKNNQTYFGIARHFTKKGHDLYMGFQPGFAITRLNRDQELILIKDQINPMFSASLGYNLYFYDYFHFFFQTRYSYGTHLITTPTDLSHLNFSAGLGFQIKTKKATDLK